MTKEQQGPLAEELGKFEFSKQAKQALDSATKIGSDYGCVETEHILLGLISNPNNMACRLLATKGLDLQTIRDNVNFLIEAEKRDLPKGASIRLTPKAKQAIRFAQNEATFDKRQPIDTHHLFFGILSTKDGRAAAILKELFGITEKNLPELRRTIRHLEMPQKLLPLSQDLQLAIDTGKKNIGWSEDMNNPDNKKGVITPVLFASMIASSGLISSALAKCDINSSKALERLASLYHIDQMGASNHADGLSKEAFDALQAASAIANDQGVQQINPIHFLLGMIYAKDNVVEATLQALGLNQVNITTLRSLAKEASISSKAS